MFTLPTTHYERISPTRNRTARERGDARVLGLGDEIFQDDNAALRWLAEQRWGGMKTQTCPHCGVIDGHYFLAGYRRWKCRSAPCGRQFSVFSGSKFNNTKLSPREVTTLLFLWQEGAEGISSRESAGPLNHDYRAMHVQVMKTREALLQTEDPTPLDGIVEVDAAFFNRHVRPPNKGTGSSAAQKKTDTVAGDEPAEASTSDGASAASGRKPKKRDPAFETVAKPRRFVHNPNLHALIAFVERLADGGIGRVRAGVVKTENQKDVDALARRYLAPTAVAHTDEGVAYTFLLTTAADHKRVKHRAMFVSPEGHHTNHVECFFGELRRGQAGRFHRIGLGYLKYYAAELAWRLEMRDKPNDVRLRDLAQRVLRSGPSVQFADMWNKRPKAGKPKVQKPVMEGVTFRVPAGSLGSVPAVLPQNRRRSSRKAPRAVPDSAGPGTDTSTK